MIAGYPSHFKEQDLIQLIGAETISQIKVKQNFAEVTLRTLKLAQTALLMDGIAIKGGVLSVKPVIA